MLRATRNVFAFVLLALALTSCLLTAGLLTGVVLIFLMTGIGSSPEAVNFNTDLRILRGSWTMNLMNSSFSKLFLEFEPAYKNEREYEFSGVFALPSGVIWTIEGTADGASELRFQPQMSRPPRAFITANLLDSIGNPVCRLYARLEHYDNVWFYTGYLSPARSEAPEACFGLKLNETMGVVIERTA